jgi:hypothetical protein
LAKFLPQPAAGDGQAPDWQQSGREAANYLILLIYFLAAGRAPGNIRSGRPGVARFGQQGRAATLAS